MAYSILNREDVPVVKIGSRKFIQRDKFFDWLDSREKKISNLTHEIEMKNKLFNDYVVIMKKMEQCIIEKNALIAEKDKRIAELTDNSIFFRKGWTSFLRYLRITLISALYRKLHRACLERSKRIA